MKKERKEKGKELQSELYRPRPRGEVAAMRRSRAHALLTAVVISVVLAALVACVVFFRAHDPTSAPTGPTEASAEEKKYTVFIDPGHGGGDSGVPVDEEHSESDLTMACALGIKEILEADERICVKLSHTAKLEEELPEEEREAMADGCVCAVSLHICSEGKGASYSLVSDSTQTAQVLAGLLGDPVLVTDPAFARPKGVAWVRLDTDVEGLDAKKISDAIMTFINKEFA